MAEGILNCYLNKPEPNKSCLLALRSIILGQSKDISETIKYGMPCFYYKNKIFCYLWIDKKIDEPYILMVDGNLIKHEALEKGSRKRMKIFRVNPNLDLPVQTIEEILKEGLSLYTSL